MSKVFKLEADAQLPKMVARYERVVLEELVVVEPEAEVEEPPVEVEPEPDINELREAILAEAREEAAVKVREAYAEGHRRGMEAGRADFERSVGESVAALQAAAAAVVHARETFLNTLEPEVVALAVRIAERILLREAETDRGLVLRTVRKALEHLTDRESIVLRVNPADLEVVRAEKLRLTEEFDGIARVVVESDAGVLPGGCIAESSLMQVDARLGHQLEAIYSALKEISGPAVNG